MRKSEKSTTIQERNDKPLRPALTPEARENQLIALAMDLAEQRLRDGTATSQEVTHFLKLGSSREKLEQENLKLNKELIEAKRDNLNSIKTQSELYEKALKAMRKYSGNEEEDNGDPNEI